jgi:hypothetical protein
MKTTSTSQEYLLAFRMMTSPPRAAYWRSEKREGRRKRETRQLANIGHNLLHFQVQLPQPFAL